MSQVFKITRLPDSGATMTCQEARCPNYEHGWVTVLDPANPQHQKAAHDIRTRLGRRFIEFPSEEAGEHLDGEGIDLPGGLLVFKFYAGQQCFKAHEDREVVFSHDRRIHVNPRDFNEDFNETVDRIATARGRG